MVTAEQTLLLEVRRLRSIVRDYEQDAEKARITIVRERLSDGSHVFNVRLPAVVVAAEDEGAAQRFADAVAELLNEYNVHHDAEVRFGY